MMPAISERTEDWRSGLAEDAIACRKLWANVVLNAVNEAATEVRNARRAAKAAETKQEAEQFRVVEANAIARFRAWAMGRDGREVMGLAGINWEPRVVEELTKYVISGVFDTTAEGKRRRNAA